VVLDPETIQELKALAEKKGDSVPSFDEKLYSGRTRKSKEFGLVH
jgi:hypothetical protein